MYCGRCGYNNEDGAPFCRSCGAPLAQAQAPSAAPAPMSSGAELQKKLATSPLLLVAIIAFTAATLLQLIRNFTVGSSLVGTIYGILIRMGIDPSMLGPLQSSLSAISGSSIVTTIIGMIPTILIIAGLWMVFASGANHSQPRLKTAGLTMIKVITIIELVLICILTVIVEVVVAIIMAAVGQMGEYASGAGSLFVVLMLVLAAIFALIIVFYARVLSTINKMKRTAITGVPVSKVSVFVAVISLISGAYSAIMTLTSFAAGILTLLNNLCNAAAMICFGVFLFVYRSKMRGQEYAQNAGAQNAGTYY